MKEENYTALQEKPLTERALSAQALCLADKKSFAYEYLEENIKANIHDIKRELYSLTLLDDINLLDDIDITYEISNSRRAIATAFIAENKMTFYKNRLINSNINKEYIHELSHFICFHFLKLQGHCLEFAIISYCLIRKYSASKVFFNSYDIHEDKAFRFLSINASEFDALICNIEFESFGELSRKAKILATKIREKSVPLGLTKLENDK